MYGRELVIALILTTISLSTNADTLTFVLRRNRDLTLKANPSNFELTSQRSVVGRLQQAGTQFTINFDGGADDLPAHRRSVDVHPGSFCKADANRNRLSFGGSGTEDRSS
jgi:hypothetical protein